MRAVLLAEAARRVRAQGYAMPVAIFFLIQRLFDGGGKEKKGEAGAAGAAAAAAGAK